MARIINNLSEGSIELPQVSAPTVTTNKLYNVGGVLTFEGAAASGAGGSDTELQYNNGGAFAGMPEFIFNDGATTGPQFSITDVGTLTSGTPLVITSETTGINLDVLNNNSGGQAARFFGGVTNRTEPVVLIWQNNGTGTVASTGLEVIQNAGAAHLDLTGAGYGIQMNGAVRLTERTTKPRASAATKGDIWLKNDTPNSLYFTDDAGTDYDLTAGGGGIGGSITDNQIAVGATTADDIEGSTELTYSGGTLSIGPASSSQKLIQTGDGDGSLKINGGDGSFNGANLILYGNTHATLANDWYLGAGADGILSYDDSADLITVNAPMTFVQAGTAAPLRIPHSGTPSVLVDGDMWTTTAGLFVRINGSTVGPLS